MHRWPKLSLCVVLACTAALLVFAPGASAFTVTADAPAVTEGNSGTVDAVFTITCEATDVGPVTATAAPGSAPAATAGSDFEEETSSNPPVLAPCALLVPLSQKVTIKVKGDTLDELNENVKLDVTVGGGTAKSAQATITDDDVPDVSIVQIVPLFEDAGPAQLTVTLSQTPVEPATVSFATENSSASAPGDFTATSGELTIPAGQTTGTITVPIVDDTAPEKVEGFYVNLSAPLNATLNATKKQATVAIFDKDTPPVPAFSLPRGVAVEEGNSGTVNLLFPITLSTAPTETVKVDWRTASFTATLPDYESANGTVTFQPGQTTKTVSVNVKGDVRDEPNEAFALVLGNPVGGTIAAGKSFGVITDDDGPKVGIGRPVPRGKDLIMLVTCPKTADLCKGRMQARIGKLKAGTVRFELAKGEGRKLKLRLTQKARRALKKRARRVKFTATVTDASGAQRVTTRRYRVPRRR